MKLNIHILFDELQDLSPQLTTSREIDLTLRQVRFSELPDGELRQDCIYLLDSAMLEEHAHLLQGIDLISWGFIDAGNPKYADLSVISLPEECRKADLFNRIQDIFEKYEQWDYGLMRSIAAHEPLQALADRAAVVLHNPFALLDITLKRILKAGPLPENYQGTIWEMVMGQGYTPAETFSLPPDELYFFLRHNNKPYFPYGSPYVHYSDLMVNLYLDGKPIAFIAATSINAPHTQGQVSLIQHIRDVMELAMASSIEFKGSAEAVTYYFEKLIKGFPVDEKVIRYHLNERGWSLCDNFRIYTITNPEGKELSDSQAEFCLFRIKKLREDVILFTYENSIIVLTRQSNSKTAQGYQEELKVLLARLGLYGGCSQIFQRFSDLKYYYIQSKAALAEGEKSSPENILWCFDDYYFPHLFSQLDASTSLKSLCHPAILGLREHDSAYGTDFVRCLQTYIANGCNIAQTGKELFMHRNTLAYRLEKIAAIIAMDVQQLPENQRMQLWFSCRISCAL